MRLEGGGGGKMGQDDTRIRQRGAGIVSVGLERSGVKNEKVKQSFRDGMAIFGPKTLTMKNKQRIVH